jgi:hypothetical protein
VTNRQDIIDAMNHYYAVLGRYNALLDRLSTPDVLTRSEVERAVELADEVEEAHRTYLAKSRLWLASLGG